MKTIEWTGGLKILSRYGRMSRGRVLSMSAVDAIEFISRGLAKEYKKPKPKKSKEARK